MIFCALTRGAIQALPGAGKLRHSEVGSGWWLTLAGDTVAEKAVEGAPLLVASEGHGAAPFLEARFHTATRALEIEKFVSSCRPAYYHFAASGEFYFSTHVRLLQAAGVELEEDTEVLPEFFLYLSVAPPRTMFRGIRQIPTWGRILVECEPGGCALRTSEYCMPTRYSRLSAPPNAEVAGRVAEIVRASMRRFALDGESAGALLSGGMDSTFLCKLLAGDGGLRETWSAAYPFESETEDFESAYAVSAAAELGTRHHVFRTTPEAYLTGVVDAIAAAEMPLAHLQSALLHLTFRDGLPRERVSILCGEAASIFGPTVNMSLYRAESPVYRLLASPPGYVMLRTAARVWRRAAGVSNNVKKMRGRHLPLADPSHTIWSFGARGDRHWMADVMGWKPEQAIAARYLALSGCEDLPAIDLAWFYNLAYALNDTVLGWSALAEAQGRTLCVPFLCQPLIDYVGSLPWSVRYRLHKHVLLLASQAVGVSDGILYRPKLSFGLNPRKWAGPGAAFEPLVAIAAQAVPEKDLRRLQRGGYATAMTLWALLNYSIWKQLWIQGADCTGLKAQAEEAIHAAAASARS